MRKLKFIWIVLSALMLAGACSRLDEQKAALNILNDREQKIIKSFYGIGCQEMTLEEIGHATGLTRERVRQIKEKAIRKLRNSTSNKLLKTYLGV